MARSYRFFLRNGTAAAGENFLLSAEDEPEIVFQLTKVLRVKAGDVVTLVARKEKIENRKLVFEVVFEVLNVLKNGVELLKKNTVENKNELSFELNLWLEVIDFFCGMVRRRLVKIFCFLRRMNRRLFFN